MYECTNSSSRTEKDLREDPVAIEELRNKSQHFVSSREASKMAQTIGAKIYLECSSLTGEGVDDMFEAATRAALLEYDDRDASGCCVLL
jgi:Rho family, other